LAEALAFVDPKRAGTSGNLVYSIEVYFLAGRRTELEALLAASSGIAGFDRFYTLMA